MDQCGNGPMIVVYPENVWYCHVRVEDADVIFEEHLVGGRPVERLIYRPLKPGANKICQRRTSDLRELNWPILSGWIEAAKPVAPRAVTHSTDRSSANLAGPSVSYPSSNCTPRGARFPISGSSPIRAPQSV